MFSKQVAPLRWDLLHSDFHRVCEIEYLKRKHRVQAAPEEWQRDPGMIGYATALLRRFALQSAKIVRGPVEDGQIEAFVVWILQIGNTPYLPWHAANRYAAGSDGPETAHRISWSALGTEPQSAQEKLDFVQKDLNIVVNVGPDDYRSDFGHLRHVQFPIFQIAQLLLPGLNHYLETDAKIWCISEVSARRGFEDEARLKAVIEKHFKVLDDDKLHAYHLAERNNVRLFEELGFRTLFDVDLHVGLAVTSRATFMMRWPVLPDSDDEDFDEAQRDEPDMRLGLEEYQSEGRTFHVEFEDKDSEDVNLIVGGPVELDSYERIRWRSTWWQNDIGQLSLTWRAADGNPR